MSHVEQSGVHNRLLRAMSPDDFDLLRPHLRSMTTTLHQIVIDPGTKITELFFPETGFVSIVGEGARTIEVGLIGCEGLVGASPVLLGSYRASHKNIVQSPGEMLRIEAGELEEAVRGSPTLHTLLLRFVQTLMAQCMQTAFVNGAFDIQARLARWLLMCQDRLGGHEFALTHIFLSVMLGVQRTSVTLTLQELEGIGVIRGRRGRIEIRDRARLIALAENGYGLPEAQYARLIEGG